MFTKKNSFEIQNLYFLKCSWLMKDNEIKHSVAGPTIERNHAGPREERKWQDPPLAEKGRHDQSINHVDNNGTCHSFAFLS